MTGDLVPEVKGFGGTPQNESYVLWKIHDKITAQRVLVGNQVNGFARNQRGEKNPTLKTRHVAAAES